MNSAHLAMMFVATVTLLGAGAPVAAQVPPNCTLAAASDPDRQVLNCAFGLTLELEAAAEMGISGEILETDPTDMTLENGAVLIEVTPGAARPQIRTPHAIAAVRGTVYVIEVSPEVTSVFVVQGEVSVSSLDDVTSQVIVGPGEGVDVGLANTTLEVDIWPAARAARLLARFGR